MVRLIIERRPMMSRWPAFMAGYDAPGHEPKIEPGSQNGWERQDGGKNDPLPKLASGINGHAAETPLAPLPMRAHGQRCRWARGARAMMVMKRPNPPFAPSPLTPGQRPGNKPHPLALVALIVIGKLKTAIRLLYPPPRYLRSPQLSIVTYAAQHADHP